MSGIGLVLGAGLALMLSFLFKSSNSKLKELIHANTSKQLDDK